MFNFKLFVENTNLNNSLNELSEKLENLKEIYNQKNQKNEFEKAKGLKIYFDSFRNTFEKFSISEGIFDNWFKKNSC